MEIVLQWLDDLDDALFAGVLVWERLRRKCLVAGVAAAALAGTAPVAADWVPLLAAVAGASVLIAVGGAAIAGLADAFTTMRHPKL